MIVKLKQKSIMLVRSMQLIFYAVIHCSRCPTYTAHDARLLVCWFSTAEMLFESQNTNFIYTFFKRNVSKIMLHLNPRLWSIIPSKLEGNKRHYLYINDFSLLNTSSTFTFTPYVAEWNLGVVNRLYFKCIPSQLQF